MNQNPKSEHSFSNHYIKKKPKLQFIPHTFSWSESERQKDRHTERQAKQATDRQTDRHTVGH